ncbi:unnamed protein product, partial [Iphiclides podalirius]
MAANKSAPDRTPLICTRNEIYSRIISPVGIVYGLSSRSDWSASSPRAQTVRPCTQETLPISGTPITSPRPSRCRAPVVFVIRITWRSARPCPLLTSPATGRRVSCGGLPAPAHRRRRRSRANVYAAKHATRARTLLHNNTPRVGKDAPAMRPYRPGGRNRIGTVGRVTSGRGQTPK